jgi:hypothetical protein
MKTINYATFEIQVTDKNEVVGYENLGTVFASRGSWEILKEKLDNLAEQRGVNDRPAFRFFSTSSGVEGYCIPALKVFWKEDFR